MSDKPDRRVQRSIRALWQALFGLLHTHDWDEISVQAICDRADVGRSTFYAHFPTKQALLESGFSQELTGIRAEVLSGTASLPPDTLATVAWLVAHLQETRGMLKRVRGTAAGLVILDRFRRALKDVLAEELALRGLTPAPLTLTFLTAGLFAALDEGLAQGEETQSLTARLSALTLAFRSDAAAGP